MEHIDGCVRRHNRFHIFECGKQKLIEFLASHIVVLDFARRSFVIDVVRRVSDDQVCLSSVHEDIIDSRVSGIAAHQTVPAKCPYITVFGEGGLLQLCIHIEVILFGFHAVIEQSGQFLLIKAGEQRIEVHTL